MALSTCKDCNREVSTLARYCVHCGRPRPTGVGAGSIVGSIAVVVIALALTAGMVCAAKRACRKISTKTGWECREAQVNRKSCLEVKEAAPEAQEDGK